ncbi:FIST N-terminal domain-containing protein [Pukyongiella litopenaei]|uniref:FIST N-terminal domain-containing protein n=1 Tax=Pukyongiella litopenaei TaxID=2605946 RepID=UPI001FCE8E63|nr:FIST N-terminal domain-containing protein [Pukyongiella litopenaei]
MPDFGRIVRRAVTSSRDPAEALRELRDQLGWEKFALVTIFVAPCHLSGLLASAINATFPDVPVIGCTTAGEITPDGIADDTIVAVGFPASHFCASVQLLTDTDKQDGAGIAKAVLDQLSEVARIAPDWQGEFAFMLNDGMARNEDRIVATIYPALGMVPLFGGSAGDGLSFHETALFAGGAFHKRASVLAILRTRCRIKVFRFDHFGPTDTRMVVTSADPERRLVREINAEPAAAEYARMVGKDPGQLSPFVFAANPVMVKVGGQYHVRAIQKIEDNGDLRFFSAIDEGLVLTVAEPEDIVTHLQRAMDELVDTHGNPDTIVACECILRKLEIDQTQARRRISSILAKNRVVGFHTYGEQFNMLHVNQTFTGVAIYAPEDADA